MEGEPTISPQEAYDMLSPDNQEAVDSFAKAFITGMVTDDIDKKRGTSKLEDWIVDEFKIDVFNDYAVDWVMYYKGIISYRIRHYEGGSNLRNYSNLTDNFISIKKK